MKFHNKRSARTILTNEARVLRELRISSQLSMKQAGLLIGVSSSYVAHVETGRTDPPKAERLSQFLAAYGGIKERSFFERVRIHHTKVTPQLELQEIIERLNENQAQALLVVAKNLVKAFD